MEDVLNALAQSDVAEYLRFSRWGYAAVNAAHILGLALLVGAIVPLDLRLLGAWPHIPHDMLARVLVPAAAAGLAIAMLTGLLLFSVRAGEYAGLALFWVKMSIVALGALSAILAHLFYGRWLQNGGRRQLARAGAVSMGCWLGALVMGRMIAFADG